MNEYTIRLGNVEVVVLALGGIIKSFRVGGVDIFHPFFWKDDEKFRGGCFFCAPWFAKSNFSTSVHGFLRSLGKPVKVIYEEKSSVTLVYESKPSENYVWPLQYWVRVDLNHKGITYTLTVNRGDDGVLSRNAPVLIACHPYFDAAGGKIIVQGKEEEDLFIPGATILPMVNNGDVIITDLYRVEMIVLGSLGVDPTMCYWSDNLAKYGCAEPLQDNPDNLDQPSGRYLENYDSTSFTIAFQVDLIQQ